MPVDLAEKIGLVVQSGSMRNKDGMILFQGEAGQGSQTEAEYKQSVSQAILGNHDKHLFVTQKFGVFRNGSEKEIKALIKKTVRTRDIPMRHI
jgi:hypothetical protein